MKIKTRIYFIATRIYDTEIPIISQIADKIRDWSYNEEISCD